MKQKNAYSNLATGFGRRVQWSGWILLLLFIPALSFAQIEITLKNSFIEKFKDRATIDATYTVDKAHAHPNPASQDGDMHVAGRGVEIGLPVVAEIMNAKDETDAVNLVHQVEGSGKTIPVTGVWRLWCEHAGNFGQVQGNPLTPFLTTNPPHVFEIHPLTKLQDISTTSSFKPIDGFQYKDAKDAFDRYENMAFTIVPGTTTTRMVTRGLGYNYVEFIMEMLETPVDKVDGSFVFASVLDLGEETLVQHRRMVFVKDTAPYDAVHKLKPGDRLHVIGIPRIDLALVSYRASHGKQKSEILTWGLPYEIVIVAVVEKNN